MVGKINRIPLRDVWAHEAVDFTPWLLDNLDFLNDVLPFTLIEAEREKAAGTSWVDVVAKDSDGGVVVIENQLGTSDHDHLGKVLTYLATYEAKRAIWIVRDARPEHIQTINWLNELGPVDFFLVKAEAFKIGDSEPAAVFTRITGPSDPLRTAGDTKRRQVNRESESLLDIIDECKCFDKMSKKDRKKVARIAESACKLLRLRVGADLSAFTPKWTHAEYRDLIASHPRLLESIKHIYEANGKENKIGRYLSPGYAAGFLYLMGCCKTDADAYRSAEQPNENLLDWSEWERARKFFVEMADDSEKVAALRDAWAKMCEEGKTSNAERWALLVNAWNSYRDGGRVDGEGLDLAYNKDADGYLTLAGTPTVGGIDLGDPEVEAYETNE